MFALILSILCALIINIIFKLYAKYNVQNFQAIVINYWVCVLTGALMEGINPLQAQVWQAPWLMHAIIIGALFILGFVTMGKTLQYFSLAIGTIMQKMSLMFSVPFGIIIFAEPLGIPKIIGLVFAFLAIILTNLPNKNSTAIIDKNQQKIPLIYWAFPILTLLTSASIESLLQYTQHTILAQYDNQQAALFSIVSFLMAAINGAIALVYLFIKDTRIESKSFIAGIALGIPNYFAIYFLLLALGWKDKSIILPINNVAVIILSIGIGYIVFKEYLSKINLIGIATAIAAIVLISMA